MSKTSKINEQVDKEVTSLKSSLNLPSTGSFNFWNGDSYTGEFTILQDKEKIVMNGRGTYKTSDNETYEGTWEGDSLKKDCKITFSDKSTFTGCVDDMKLQGPGTYRFKENIEIEGEFLDNNLIGKVYLKDPTKHLWEADADKGGTHLTFYPLHPFWQDIINLPFRDQVFLGEAGEDYTFM